MMVKPNESRHHSVGIDGNISANQDLAIGLNGQALRPYGCEGIGLIEMPKGNKGPIGGGVDLIGHDGQFGVFAAEDARARDSNFFRALECAG